MEFAADGKRAAFSVAFKFEEPHKAIIETLGTELSAQDSKVEIVRGLKSLASFASEIELTIDRESSRAEILVVMPFGQGSDTSTPKAQIKYFELAGEIPPQSSDHEYVELADVEYGENSRRKNRRGKSRTRCRETNG